MWSYKGYMGRPHGRRDALYLVYQHHILVMILCCRFVMFYYCRNCVKGIGDLSVLVFIRTWESIIILKSLF